jgi:hypothetical protein
MDVLSPQERCVNWLDNNNSRQESLKNSQETLGKIDWLSHIFERRKKMKNMKEKARKNINSQENLDEFSNMFDSLADAFVKLAVVHNHE